MKKGKILIGTSGWKYKHWKGTFYPLGLKEKDQFTYYLDFFDTVELNNSFYRQPSAENFVNWKNAVPDGFTYAVKANRYFTHLKKLKTEAAAIQESLDNIAHLGNRLGPILFQLPPKWNINAERLDHFVSMLPKGYRYVFEFRNHTWYTKEVNQILLKHNIAFCIYELAGHISPLTITADFIYIRLHGPGAKYQGSYHDKVLNKWALFIETAANDSKDVYLYFDNDEAGYAAFNAQRLVEMTNKP